MSGKVRVVLKECNQNAKPRAKVQWPKLTDEKRKEAIAEVMVGGSIRDVAARYQMPKSTLFDAFQGKKSTPGRNPVLPTHVEDRIAEWVGNMGLIGYGVGRAKLIDKTQEIVKSIPLTTPWEDGRPSLRWYQLFMGRHPWLKRRQTMILSRERSAVTQEVLEEWFIELRQYMTTAGYPDIFNDPTRIYNADESGFPLAPECGKVLYDVRNGKHVYQAGLSSSKRQVTGLLCMSAAGHYTKPLIVFPGVLPRVELRHRFYETFPQGLFGNSENGWMDSELFAQWLENGFNVDITQRRITKPVLLLVDGAKVHISIESAEYCEANGIYLYTLYPNSTHITQPLDLGVMGSIKKIYNDEVRSWCSENFDKTYDKLYFGDVFAKVYLRACTVQNAVSSFEELGLFPWNPAKLDTKKLFASKLFDPRDNPPMIPMTDRSLVEETGETSGRRSVEATSTSPPEDDVTSATPPEPSTSSTPKESRKERPKRIQVDGEWYDLVPMKKTMEEVLDESLAIPQVPQKKKRLGPAQVPGLSRCVSSQEWIDKLNAAKAEKEAKAADVERRKEERRVAAEQKRIAKEAKEAERKEKKEKGKGKGKGKSGTATVTDGEISKTKPKRQVRRRRFYDESSSSDEDEVIYEDSSETDEDEYDVLAMRCSECDTRFKRDERRMAVGCDQAHCGRWFHPGCTDLETEGKTEDEIAAIMFTCKYC